jgi:ketosteroid isomerase-like protein
VQVILVDIVQRPRRIRRAEAEDAMATNAERAAVLVRALEAAIVGDTAAIPELYTTDVKGWAPALAVASAEELAAAFEHREGAFSDVELDVSPFDVADGRACVEWIVTLTHSGPLDIGGDVVVEPTGLRVSLHGVAVAEFEGDRIASFRQYWDRGELLDQLPLAPPPE